MKPQHAKIVIWVIWSAVIAALVAGLFYAETIMGERRCKQVDIAIDKNETDQFLTNHEIEEMLFPAKKDPITNAPLKSINFKSIENKLEKNPFIEKAEAYAALSGKVKVNILERQPVIRITNGWGEQFYIGSDNVMFPLKSGSPARVMIATGDIWLKYREGINLGTINDSIIEKSNIGSLLYLNRFIASDDLLSSLIGQININKENEIELIPNTGNHLVIIGDTSNLEAKFAKLIIFYDRVLSKKGWDLYSTINLKFDKQIICIK